MKKIVSLGLTALMAASIVPATVSAASYYNEWVEKDGKWYYYGSDGLKVKYNSMYDNSDGKYYVLNSKGARVTTKGWYTTNYRITNFGEKIKLKTKYYLKSDGSCTTGWKKIGKKYYFFDSDGKMAESTTKKSKDGEKLYLVGADGARITKQGWYELKCTYFNSYYGEKYIYKQWFYVNKDKQAQTGIKKIKGKKYLFDDSGALMQNNFCCFTDKKTGKYVYYAGDKNGVLITKKGKHKLTQSGKMSSYSYSVKYTENAYVYVNKDGTLFANGLKKIGDKYYWFDPMMARCTYNYGPDGTRYYFGRSGVAKRTIKPAT